MIAVEKFLSLKIRIHPANKDINNVIVQFKWTESISGVWYSKK